MTRTIKIHAEDGREQVVEVADGPNAHTRAMVHCELRLRGQIVTYEELIDGSWMAYGYDAAASIATRLASDAR